MHRARIGQPGERVGGGAALGTGERAQVGEDRARLHDRLAQARLGLVGERLLV
jgi:hypothetical protein